jgi:hypothetical protein
MQHQSIDVARHQVYSHWCGAALALGPCPASCIVASRMSVEGEPKYNNLALLRSMPEQTSPFLCDGLIVPTDSDAAPDPDGSPKDRIKTGGWSGDPSASTAALDQVYVLKSTKRLTNPLLPHKSKLTPSLWPDW